MLMLGLQISAFGVVKMPHHRDKFRAQQRCRRQEVPERIPEALHFRSEIRKEKMAAVHLKRIIDYDSPVLTVES